MTDLPRWYDAWRLTDPESERLEIGTEEGQPCLRIHEPDEDAPRGYKPKPCRETMEQRDGITVCGTCGESGHD